MAPFAFVARRGPSGTSFLLLLYEHTRALTCTDKQGHGERKKRCCGTWRLPSRCVFFFFFGGLRFAARKEEAMNGGEDCADWTKRPHPLLVHLSVVFPLCSLSESDEGRIEGVAVPSP